ncbi:MAG: UvrD-helicase domain-containing protein [Spirochaetales bacterium]|jgi:ATP-dependent helicase/nuclease subunit A|nr:UvrD-helicase domain-containing protein [Spirochaetales bacterium]
MSGTDILTGLNGDQALAAAVSHNAVVAAGAGSGKTKTLASRYAWLVMEKGLKVEEILSLTFTNKAVGEMYDRIYRMLELYRDNPAAREAIESFHKARISTLDSFCAGIARTAARRYGISPDFIIDNAGVKALAMEAALPFVLDNRENRALQLLLANKKIKTIAEELFAAAVLNHGFVSSPPDFDGYMRNQETEIRRAWKEKTGDASARIDTAVREMEEITNTRSPLYARLQEVLARPVPVPDPGPLLDENTPAGQETARRQFREYFVFLTKLKTVNLQGGGEEYKPLKSALKELRDPLFAEMEALANSILQKDITRAVFPLVEKFFGEFDTKKRQAGILSFNDVARLAVDALAQYPDIRQAYKDSLRAVMIDEFQDNNSLQRDLIFLLAENSSRREKGIPSSGELEADKMFFVGDEKQSIYRFRGADVAVFRSLSKTLGNSLNLKYNYRSKPILIDAFNYIFGGLDPEDEALPALPAAPAVFLPSGGAPDFEAAYARMYSRGATPEEDRQNPPVHFCFLDKGRLPENDAAALQPFELEAAFIARRIKEMVDGGYKVQRRGEAGAITFEACCYNDFAILQRVYTHQHSLEKFCKDFGVPFNADRPAGLFTDAPINDLYMLLRLLAYPEDRLAYAAVIRSPFARLSDAALTLCMLDEKHEPFSEDLADSLPEEERGLYRETGKRYRELAQAARTLPVSELLTRLWYDEGGRFDTLWSAPAQVYMELFDVFFKIAQDTDSRGKTLPDFLEYIEDLIAKEEKLDDQDVPSEGGAGVRIMSIHKSKGLEFPVVFIYDGSHGGKNTANTDPIYFHEKWGISLNLPLAEELPGKGGNYFHILQKEEEKKKNIAELRRLLYVAMTRAESCLYFTASLPAQTKKEKETNDLSGGEYNAGHIRERLSQLMQKRGDRNDEEETDEEKGSSFFELILPILPADSARLPFMPFTIEAIPLLSRGELRAAASIGHTKSAAALPSMREAAEAAAALYEKARTIESAPALPPSIPASLLHYTADEYAQGSFAGDTPADSAQVADGSLEAILKKAKLEAADFGTIVHSFLEARLNGQPTFIPPKMLARLEDKDAEVVRLAAEKMTHGFLDSDLGRLSTASSYRRTEFPVLTMVTVRGADGREKSVPVTGQIDLLFEADAAMHIVDFKTDSAPDPARHLGQLAVYARAACDIFGKPVRAWLFYLRTGRAEELTADIQNVSIEKMAQAYVLNSGQTV